MDMSAKLNVSYPAPVAASTPASKSVATSAVTPAASNTAVAATPASKEADANKLKLAVQEMEKFVQSVKRNLEFSIDESSGTVVVKVIASDTGEIVRQLPSEEALKLADSLSSAGAVLFSGKA
ncbi:MAG: flaG [Pseudomonas sp.]|uniref:flagellar protein FlaG n=1 Tax=Pseudomonas sp. TaxID=306 RepID=UPI0026210411|nr:flagellar protein FlaG [Pseudomonas sp.]MDB6049975.1 flaG [Pseudomonas sp.]